MALMKPSRTRPRPRPRARARADARARRASRAMARLVRLMDTLRSPRGCPWDREQTHETLRAHLIEETYEALDAIDRRAFDKLPEELGDVLFQCVFHAQIAAEAGRFDLADAIDAISAKLIRRHPHVFLPSGRPLPVAAHRRSGVRTPARVKEQWEQIKAREQAASGARRRVLAGVPRSMPALLRAHEIGRRVGAVGFDWSRPDDVVTKIEEEVHELRGALHESPGRAAEEFGDLLFSVANLSRKLGIEPESALRAANDKFSERFAALEAEFERQGKSIHGASLEEMETVWRTIKGQKLPT
jgi:MazG family protein